MWYVDVTREHGDSAKGLSIYLMYSKPLLLRSSSSPIQHASSPFARLNNSLAISNPKIYKETMYSNVSPIRPPLEFIREYIVSSSCHLCSAAGGSQGLEHLTENSLLCPIFEGRRLALLDSAPQHLCKQWSTWTIPRMNYLVTIRYD